MNGNKVLTICFIVISIIGIMFGSFELKKKHDGKVKYDTEIKCDTIICN